MLCPLYSLYALYTGDAHYAQWPPVRLKVATGKPKSVLIRLIRPIRVKIRSYGIILVEEFSNAFSAQTTEVMDMAHTETLRFEGTPEQVTVFLGKLPKQKRYRLVEIEEGGKPVTQPAPLADPLAAASIALLQSWIAEAPTDPEEIRAAEEDLREFQRNMNLPRKETGVRLHYPEVEGT